MDAEIAEKLKTLEKLLGNMFADLLDINLEVINGGYTEYPIFIVYEGELDLGQLMLDAEEYKLPFSFNVATMEDFQEEQIIFADKTEDFKKAYGDPKKHICIFWIFGEQAGFIFYPIAQRATDQNQEG